MTGEPRKSPGANLVAAIVMSLRKVAASIGATRISRIMGRNLPYDYFRDWEEKATR
jgi:hypothetical protein